MTTEPTITAIPVSSFMETYLEYDPFKGVPGEFPVMFLHQYPDGHVALINWAQGTSSVCCVFEDPDSSTGWTRVDQPITGAMRAAVSIGGDAPKLLAYTDQGAFSASLVGGLGPFSPLPMPTGYKVPCCDCRQLIDGCSYFYEGGFPDGPVFVRDLTTLQSFAVDDPSPFVNFDSEDPFYFQLPNSRAGIARLVFENNGFTGMTSAMSVLGQDGVMHAEYQSLPILPTAMIQDGQGGVEFFDWSNGQINSWRYQFDPAGTGPLLPMGQSSYPQAVQLKIVCIAAANRGADGAVELLLTMSDAFTGGPVEVWSVSRPTLTDPFGDLVYLTTPQYVPFSTVPTHRAPVGNTCFVAPRNGDGALELWRRNSSGGYEVSVVSLELDDVPVSTPTMRYGVTLMQGGVPLADQSVTVTAGYNTTATINGRSVGIGTRPYTAQTDANGQLWISVVVEGSLAVPVVTVSYPGLAVPDTQFEGDTRFHDFLANVTADQLVAAKDPRDGSLVLPSPANAPAAASALNQVMKLVTCALLERPGRPAPDARGRLSIGIREVPAGTRPGRRQLSREKLAGQPCWRLTTVNSVLNFEVLSPEAATAAAAEILKLPPVPVPEGFFDDAWDFIVSTAEAVWDKAVEVAQIAWDGVTMTLQLVIDGLKYAYSGVIDTLERALDAVNFILDQAGAAMGAAVGWLLGELGFLFDWAAIKARRDQIRNDFRTGLTAAMTQAGDPRVAVNGFIGQIDRLESAVNGFVAQYGAAPAGQTPFGSLGSAMPVPVAALLDLPEVTWLIDKLSECFKRATGVDLGPNLPGLADAIQQFLVALQALPGTVLDSMGAILDMLATYATDPARFASADVGPLVAAAGQIAVLWMDALKAVLAAAGEVLYVFWANPDALIDWFDAPVAVPFFNGFYRGLTGNTFSLFDACCLAAAISATAFTDRVEAAASAAVSPFKSTAIALGACRVPISGLATTITALRHIIPLSSTGFFLPGKLDLISSVGIDVMILADADEKYLLLAYLGLVGAAAGVVTRWPGQRANLSNAAVVVSGVLTLVKLSLDGFSDTKVALYGGASIAGNAVTFAANSGWAKSPQQCFGLGMLQSTFSTAKLGLYAAS